MKFHAITTLATPLLALTITAAASHTVFAQDDAVTEPEQLERDQLERPDDTNANSQEVPLSDTDCVDLPDTASQNAQGAGAANAQGANPQANPNAQGSRADENRSAAAAGNSNAQIAQNRDDCLDIRRQTPASED